MGLPAAMVEVEQVAARSFVIRANERVRDARDRRAVRYDSSMTLTAVLCRKTRAPPVGC